jgi:DNA polymerase V
MAYINPMPHRIIHTAYAGFPSPAEDYLEPPLEITDYLVKNAPATFYMRVSGDSMAGAGIQPGDVLVIDRSLQPKTGDVVVATLNDGFVVKRLTVENNQLLLESTNCKYAPIPVASFSSIWGVVTFVIHSMVR